jgi:hypothetical protein
MNREDLPELAVHYGVMLIISLAALAAVRAAVGDVDIWIRLGVIVVIVFLYRPLVLALGVAPDTWEAREQARDR